MGPTHLDNLKHPRKLGSLDRSTIFGDGKKCPLMSIEPCRFEVKDAERQLNVHLTEMSVSLKPSNELIPGKEIDVVTQVQEWTEPKLAARLAVRLIRFVFHFI